MWGFCNAGWRFAYPADKPGDDTALNLLDPPLNLRGEGLRHRCRENLNMKCHAFPIRQFNIQAQFSTHRFDVAF
ncbi:hypothetical protein ABIE11_003270 [Lelliottia sp. 489]